MSNRINLFFVCFAVVWVTIVFSSSFSAPFYLDDFESIVNHMVLRNSPTWATIAEVFTFREITYFSFALNLQWLGEDPVGFRVINLLLHFINGVLTYLLIRLLLTHFTVNKSPKRLRYTALFCGLLFVVLPLNSQAVIYVVQRGVLLAYLFAMLAFIAYLQWRFNSTTTLRKLFFLTLFLVAVVAGLMSKQNFATLFLGVFVFEALHKKGVLNGYVSQLIIVSLGALFSFLLADFLFSMNLLDKFNSFTNTTTMTQWQYFTHQLSVLWLYSYKFFIPHPLLLEYEPILNTWSDSATWLAFIGHIVVIGVAVAKRDKAPLLSFAIMLFYALHSVESSGLIVLDDLAFEHRTYLPNLALLLVVAHVLITSKVPSKYIVVICGGILLVFSQVTYQRGQLWSDKLDFYRNELTHTFQNPRAYSAVGVYYAERGRLQKAEKWMQMGLQVSEEIGKVEAGAITSYMKVLYDNGKIATANRFAAVALKEIDNRKIKARIFIVMAEQKINQGYCNMAEGLIERAARLDPENAAVPLLQKACGL